MRILLLEDNAHDADLTGRALVEAGLVDSQREKLSAGAQEGKAQPVTRAVIPARAVLA